MRAAESAEIREPRLTGWSRWFLGPWPVRLFWTMAVILTLASVGTATIATYVNQKNLTLAQGQTTANQFSSSLMAFLDKFRVVPPLMSQMNEILDFYRGEASQETTARLLNIVRGMSGARQIRLLDAQGRPLLVSDGYRSAEDLPAEGTQDYFRAAIGGRLGRGHRTIAGDRLYLFAAPVRVDNEVIGVIVLDASLALVEQAWALARDPIFITDENDIVFMGNRNLWTLEKFLPDSPAEQGAIRIEDVFWDAGVVNLSAPEQETRTYLHVQNAIAVLDWRLHVLADMASTRSNAINVGVMTGLGATIFFAIMGWLFSSHRASMRSHRRDRAISLRLERRVRDRTRAVLETNSALEREVAERRNAERELYRAQEELLHAAKLAAIGQTSAALSHEFNQPLAAIRFNAENARTLLSMSRHDRVSGKLDSIIDLVDRMGNMSRMLRVFASRRGGSTASVSLKSVLEDVIKLTEVQLAQSRIKLEISVPPSLQVLGDPVGLTHVFSNMISNACQVMGDSRVKRITISAEADAQDICIRVADTGPGIAEEHLQNLFEPFFTTKDLGQGLGLGLAIAKAIVTTYDGTIEAHNRPGGQGAEFVIRLPNSAMLVDERRKKLNRILS